MRCTECKKELRLVAYYHGLKVCPRCFDKLKWKENHLTLEELKEIAKKRVFNINRRKKRKEPSEWVYGLKKPISIRNWVDNPQPRKGHK